MGIARQTIVAAALSAVALAQSSHAAERMKLKLGGFFNAAAIAVSQNGPTGLRSQGLVTSGEVFVQGSIDFDDLWTAGFRAEFELERDNGYREPFSPIAQYEDDFVDEAWGFFQGPFGRIEFGQQDGAADQMGFSSPSASRALRVNNPDIYVLECPAVASCPNSPRFRPYTPNGLQLRTDVHVSGDYLKVSYYTPRFHGFQAGISYTPELTKGLHGRATRQSGQTNQQSEIWELGLTFAERFEGVDLGLSAAFLTGRNEDKVNTFGLGGAPDDVEEYGAGVSLAWREWTAGGSFKRTNVLGGGHILNDATTGPGYNVFRDVDTQLWEAGVKYETGPWSAGLNYIQAEAEIPLSAIPQKGKGIGVAVGLIAGPGIHLSAGYQHFDYEGPSGGCGISCDTKDGGVFFLETSVNF